MSRHDGTRARSASDGLADALRRIGRLPVAGAPGSCFLLLLLAACSTPGPVEVEEKPDRWHSREAQSDFLDIGEQAGIEWLSFVPQDQKKYPEYFEGLDRDQKARLRLGPKESRDRVLLNFNLPEGAKIWPVDWYGTELMAADLPDHKGFSLAIAKVSDDSLRSVVADVAFTRLKLGFQGSGDTGLLLSSLFKTDEADIWTSSLLEGGSQPSARQYAAYGARTLSFRTGEITVFAELVGDAKGATPLNDGFQDELERVLSSISIKRELALEGSPKHKVSSSLDELLGGTLHFPEGTLKLPIQDGHLVRKTGGDSTIQVDGEGAEPWILIRRLDETELEGDLRVRVRNDTAFKRRLKVASANFGRGRQPENAKLPIVTWSYVDSSAGQQLLGIMKAGNEILNFEVVSTGLHESIQRRAALKAALSLLAGTSGEPETEAPEFEPLNGWNVGTTGRDE